MVSKIVWSSLAVRSYIDNIKYLESSWTKKEVSAFISATEKKLKVLIQFPEIGYASRQNKHLRKTLIGKRVILIYRYRQGKNTIELVRFFNGRQDPKKLEPKKT